MSDIAKERQQDASQVGENEKTLRLNLIGKVVSVDPLYFGNQKNQNRYEGIVTDEGDKDKEVWVKWKCDGKQSIVSVNELLVVECDTQHSVVPFKNQDSRSMKRVAV